MPAVRRQARMLERATADRLAQMVGSLLLPPADGPDPGQPSSVTHPRKSHA
jgi:hypothetical protein